MLREQGFLSQSPVKTGVFAAACRGGKKQFVITRYSSVIQVMGKLWGRILAIEVAQKKPPPQPAATLCTPLSD